MNKVEALREAIAISSAHIPHTLCHLQHLFRTYSNWNPFFLLSLNKRQRWKTKKLKLPTKKWWTNTIIFCDKIPRSLHIVICEIFHFFDPKKTFSLARKNGFEAYVWVSCQPLYCQPLQNPLFTHILVCVVFFLISDKFLQQISFLLDMRNEKMPRGVKGESRNSQGLKSVREWVLGCGGQVSRSQNSKQEKINERNLFGWCLEEFSCFETNKMNLFFFQFSEMKIYLNF